MDIIDLTEEMFNGGQPVAQGEVLIWMKKYAPLSVRNGLSSLNMSELNVDDSGGIILGHSKSGHHHILRTENTPCFSAIKIMADPANDSLYDMHLEQTCLLIHMRSNDNHKAFRFPPGDYICRIREEQSPTGWRRVAD